MIKVFISHKKEDSNLALQLKKAFDNFGVSAYLDVLDNSINFGGKHLTDHIKNQLNQCTDIIVVMSEKTIQSWWVPFEIGMAAQKDMPTATFLSSNVCLPDYLTYWPRLKRINDVSTYITVRKKYDKKPILESRQISSNEHKIQISEFYAELKYELKSN